MQWYIRWPKTRNRILPFLHPLILFPHQPELALGWHLSPAGAGQSHLVGLGQIAALPTVVASILTSLTLGHGHGRWRHHDHRRVAPILSLSGLGLLTTPRPLTLSVCGVTPFDTTHIGHARTFLTFDVLVRYLRSRGAEVRYCQNVTDVDDPLFERAKRDGVTWQELTEQQVAQLQRDYAGLNIAPPTYFPRASEEIGAMIPIIERLVELGHAYVVDGEVYFSVATDPEFGKMAHMGYDELLATANQRGNRPDDPKKRDPLDFVLWQTGKDDDPKWPSPLGDGRPGWHIECSAMATKYLGDQLDIHGGGADLIFPHHPCEMAQSEPVPGTRPW